MYEIERSYAGRTPLWIEANFFRLATSQLFAFRNQLRPRDPLDLRLLIAS